MKRIFTPIAIFIAAVNIGCGSHTAKTGSTRCAAPAQAGCSLPKAPRTLAAPPTGARLFPDISEYQGCPSFSGPVVFKVYEGGYGEDHSAKCNAARVHRLHVWAGAYAFLRPANCAGQARSTVAIVRSLGGVPGPVVADAEVPLPAGCVSRFVGTVRALLGGPVDVYSAPGTWPGGSLSAPLWVATYGPTPGCVAGVCAHVAWQFSDHARCGIGAGDCSIDNGILSQVRADPTLLRRLRAQIKHLRIKLRTHGCAARRHRHERLGPKCRGWFAAGDRVHAHIRRLEA